MYKVPFPSQSRFSEFIIPFPPETKDEDSVSDKTTIDFVLYPSMDKDAEEMKETMMSLTASLLVPVFSVIASGAVGSYLQQWLWNWGQTLLIHFCGVLASRCIVGFFVLGIRSSSMHLASRSLVYSILTTVCLSFLILLVCIFIETCLLWESSASALVFEHLRTIVYLFTIGQTSFCILQSFYLHRMFNSWMQEAASHLYKLEALMGPPLSKERREELDANPISGTEKKLESMYMAVFCRDRLPVVNFRSVKSLLGEVVDITQSILPPFRANSWLRDAVDRELWVKIDGIRDSKFRAGSQIKILEEAQKAFWRVASPGNKFINREDILRFLAKDDVNMAYALLTETYGTGKIDVLAFQEWVVEAYQLRKSLVHAITDTKIMMSKLYKFAMLSITIIFLMTSLPKGMISTAVLVSFIPELHLLFYMFRSTVKSIFESILFVLVAHPFDVGDCCEIDGVQMIVEEMNITETVFLRFDHEKICYRNSQLLAKPIINYSRNPDVGEKIEFLIDVSTTEEIVDKLSKHIEEYLKINENHWKENHAMLMGEVRDSKMKMNLTVLHKTNYHNFPEMKKRRAKLLLALKYIFERLGIRNYVFLESPTKSLGLQEHTLSNFSGNMPFNYPVAGLSDMAENIELLIDVSTPQKTFDELRERVETHLQKDHISWQGRHSLSVEGIEESKIKVNLNVVPEANCQNFREMNRRRSDLFFALKNIIESLGIKLYSLRRFPATSVMDAYLKRNQMSWMSGDTTRVNYGRNTS